MRRWIFYTDVSFLFLSFVVVVVAAAVAAASAAAVADIIHSRMMACTGAQNVAYMVRISVFGQEFLGCTVNPAGIEKGGHLTPLHRKKSVSLNE